MISQSVHLQVQYFMGVLLIVFVLKPVNVMHQSTLKLFCTKIQAN